MSQNLPPLNALRAFEATARHNSMTKAAEELHVTRAAISHQIKHLEEYLGVELAVRQARSITLTAAGQAALPKLREGFNNLADAVHLMRQQSETQRLRVWMAPSFASKWLMPRLNRFASLHPEIDLDIGSDTNLIASADGDRKSMENLFRAHDVDVIIRFGSGHYPGCQVEKLFSVDAVPLCSPELVNDDHPSPLKSPADLANHTLLHDETGYPGRPTWERWLEVNQVQGVNHNRGLHFNQVSLAMTAAIDAQGVLLSMRPLARGDIEAGRLCIPFELPLALEHAYHAITIGTNQHNKAPLQAFMQWMLDEVNADRVESKKD